MKDSPHTSFSNVWIVSLSPQCRHQPDTHPSIMEAWAGTSWDLVIGVTDKIYEG